jgi:hypothetical protein
METEAASKGRRRVAQTVDRSSPGRSPVPRVRQCPIALGDVGALLASPVELGVEGDDPGRERRRLGALPRLVGLLLAVCANASRSGPGADRALALAGQVSEVGAQHPAPGPAARPRARAALRAPGDRPGRRRPRGRGRGDEGRARPSRRDARLPGMGGLALPGEPRNPRPGACVGFGEGSKGGRLATAGVGLQHGDAPITTGQVTHRRALVGPEVRVDGRSPLDVAVLGGAGPDRSPISADLRQLARHFRCRILTTPIGTPGFEPGTPATQRRCATRLRYVPGSGQG